jgi:hypothetical protein
VPKSSAVVPGSPNAEAIAINRNHSDMVKFLGADDDGYKKFSGHLLLMAGRACGEIERRWASHSRVGGMY